MTHRQASQISFLSIPAGIREETVGFNLVLQRNAYRIRSAQYSELLYPFPDHVSRSTTPAFETVSWMTKDTLYLERTEEHSVVVFRLKHELSKEMTN